MSRDRPGPSSIPNPAGDPGGSHAALEPPLEHLDVPRGTSPTPADLEGSATDEALANEAARLRAKVESLEGELAEAREATGGSSEAAALGTLTGLLAHEINNLLTPIGSYAQLAIQRPQDEELRDKALLRASDGAARGGRICEAILALARGGAVGDPRSAEQEAVASVAACWRAAVEGLGDRSGGAMSLILGKGLGESGADIRVGIGVTALEQILSNLLINAIRATRARWEDEVEQEGHVWLRLDDAAAVAADDAFTWHRPLDELPDLGHTPVRGRWIALVVGDNGCGMDAARVASAAGVGGGRGGRGGGSAPRAEGAGRGLGLAVCREMLTHAGGVFGVRSQEGEGSAFAVLVPRISTAPSGPVLS